MTELNYFARSPLFLVKFKSVLTACIFGLNFLSDLAIGRGFQPLTRLVTPLSRCASNIVRCIIVEEYLSRAWVETPQKLTSFCQVDLWTLNAPALAACKLDSAFKRRNCTVHSGATRGVTQEKKLA